MTESELTASLPPLLSHEMPALPDWAVRMKLTGRREWNLFTVIGQNSTGYALVLYHIFAPGPGSRRKTFCTCRVSEYLDHHRMALATNPEELVDYVTTIRDKLENAMKAGTTTVPPREAWKPFRKHT